MTGDNKKALVEFMQTRNLSMRDMLQLLAGDAGNNWLFVFDSEAPSAPVISGYEPPSEYSKDVLLLKELLSGWLWSRNVREEPRP